MVNFVNWLQKRYLFDVRARNQTILREFLSRIKEFDTPRILDLGAGLGANFRYLYDRITGDQIWYFLDKNKNLLTKSLEQLSDIVNVEIHPTKPFNIGSNTYEIELYHSDINQSRVAEIDADIIVANAFFDLITKEQFEGLITKLDMDLLYLTINYSGMKFSEETEEDRHYIDLYNEHMRRQQDFGRAMGATCANRMNEILNKHHFDTVVGPSDWEISSNQTDMLNYLVQYMEDAIHELLPSDDLEEFHTWLKLTRQRIENHSLQMQVKHDDILAIRMEN